VLWHALWWCVCRAAVTCCVLCRAVLCYVCCSAGDSIDTPPQLAASYLCLLNLDLQRITSGQPQHSTAQHSRGTTPSGDRDDHNSQTIHTASRAHDVRTRSSHPPGHQAFINGSAANPPSASPLSGGNGSYGDGSNGVGPAGYVSVLPLPQQPLARFLAADVRLSV
jgi:hypothetical protein